MRIIAFTGTMGSGKSTAISLLKEVQHKSVHLFKFAYPLYMMQEKLYKIISPVYQKPEGFVKDRKLLQWLGTEWGRALSPTLWVDLWLENVKYHMETYPNMIIVCDDVRFDNEAEAIKSLGGIIIKLESKKSEERNEAKDGISGHVSENGLDLKHVDYIIENNGTVEDLKQSLLTLNFKEGLW